MLISIADTGHQVRPGYATDISMILHIVFTMFVDFANFY